MTGEVVAVCISEGKGTAKENVGRAVLRPEWGLEGDAHAGPWHRQVSLLGWESIEKMRARGLDVREGSFAENVTTRGLELHVLPCRLAQQRSRDHAGDAAQRGKWRAAAVKQHGDDDDQRQEQVSALFQHLAQ